MSKKRYMELLLEQIRNKNARELVSREISFHIEDQEEVYRSQQFPDLKRFYQEIHVSKM